MMRVLTADIDGRAVRAAMDVLDHGGIVAYQTETFYALGARFDDEAALTRLFELKGRGLDKSVGLIVSGEAAADGIAFGINDLARAIMRRYWPGPLTLLLPARPGLSDKITSMGRVAVRAPGESFALRLARAVGYPITATSANPASMPPAENAQQVAAMFPRGIDLLIDGGPAPGGLPSTILDVTGVIPMVIRPGAHVPVLPDIVNG